MPPPPSGPYSQAVVSNGFAFLSGQIPLDPGDRHLDRRRHFRANRTGAGEFEGRAGGVRIFAGTGGQDHGVPKGHGRVHADERGLREVLSENPPARATVEAARLPKDVRVEIDCIADVA